MKYLALTVIVFLLSSCCQQNKNLFYIQHTKVSKSDLPNDCSASFIRQINTMWLKNGKKPCHYFNTFSLSFSLDNRDCILGMEKSLLVRLLGKPDKEGVGTLVYIFDDTCDDKMDVQPDPVFRKDVVFKYSPTDNVINDITYVSKNSTRH